MVGVVIGSYQLVRKLGEGGMGAVYLAQHTLLGRRAAVKVLLPALSARPDIVSRFFNEARAVTSISDPGIVQVFDFGYHTDGSAFIVMEFLEGEPLDQRLRSLGRFSVDEALRLTRQLATSLAAAHAQHIVHRDLKPENIFLVRDAEVASGWRTKILDFGIAKLSDDHPGKFKTHTGMLMGTPVYMSPEQCRGLAEVDHRSDVYALGCVLFHLLAGRPPFEGEGPGDIISAHIREPAPVPSSVVWGLPPAVDALVLRCLAKAPAHRYPTMTELAAAITQTLAQLPAEAMQSASGAVARLATQDSAPSAVSAMPTTLGASAGQLPSPRPSSRPGRWIAGLLVAGAIGTGIAMVGTRAASHEVVASSPTPSSRSELVKAADQVGSATTSPPMATRPPDPVLVDAGIVTAALEVESPADASGSTPVNAEPVQERVAPPPQVKRLPRPRTPAPPKELASTKPAPAAPAHAPPAAGASKCMKADFAAVYDAPDPAPAAVHLALRNLKACHDAGAISDAELERYQTALVTKL